MYVPPNTRIYCLTVSFSKEWLTRNVLVCKESFENLRQKIDSSERFTMFEYMTASERRLARALVDEALEKPVSSFYIKSGVLKIISDFFDAIKERESVCFDNMSTNNMLDAVLAETEKLLCSHIRTSMPDLKSLACKYGLSESTLKRHFIQRFGLNVSGYFISKKMEYVRQIICEKQLSLSNAAHMVGYKNISHFITMFRKHDHALSAVRHAKQY